MKRIASRVLLLSALAACSTWVDAKTPDCTSPDAWPAGMAFTHMKNAGIVSSEGLDLKRTKIARLGSEQIGKDLHRQIHLIQFFKTSGEPVLAITVNDASSEECSMSGVDVYVVSKQLGDYSRQRGH